jgi:hypothetical protein
MDEFRFGGAWFGRLWVFLKESVSLFSKGLPFFLSGLDRVILIFKIDKEPDFQTKKGGRSK